MRDADEGPDALAAAQTAQAWRQHRREQKRRWAELPLADLVAALQEMGETAEWLRRAPSEVRESPPESD